MKAGKDLCVPLNTEGANKYSNDSTQVTAAHFEVLKPESGSATSRHSHGHSEISWGAGDGEAGRIAGGLPGPQECNRDRWVVK